MTLYRQERHFRAAVDLLSDKTTAIEGLVLFGPVEAR